MKEGESLKVNIEDLELSLIGTKEVMFLEIYRRGKTPIRALALNSLGTLSYVDEIFEGYRPLPVSQRYLNN